MINLNKKKQKKEKIKEPLLPGAKKLMQFFWLLIGFVITLGLVLSMIFYFK